MYSIPVMSWFISPLLSGIMSGILFFIVRAFILRKVIFLIPSMTFHGSHPILLKHSGSLADVIGMWPWKVTKLFVLYTSCMLWSSVKEASF
jgi:phosphate/sulfate permease